MTASFFHKLWSAFKRVNSIGKRAFGENRASLLPRHAAGLPLVLALMLLASSLLAQGFSLKAIAAPSDATLTLSTTAAEQNSFAQLITQGDQPKRTDPTQSFLFDENEDNEEDDQWGTPDVARGLNIRQRAVRFLQPFIKNYPNPYLPQTAPPPRTLHGFLSVSTLS